MARSDRNDGYPKNRYKGLFFVLPTKPNEFKLFNLDGSVFETHSLLHVKPFDVHDVNQYIHPDFDNDLSMRMQTYAMHTLCDIAEQGVIINQSSLNKSLHLSFLQSKKYDNKDVAFLMIERGALKPCDLIKSQAPLAFQTAYKTAKHSQAGVFNIKNLMKFVFYDTKEYTALKKFVTQSLSNPIPCKIYGLNRSAFKLSVSIERNNQICCIKMEPSGLLCTYESTLLLKPIRLIDPKNRISLIDAGTSVCDDHSYDNILAMEKRMCTIFGTATRPTVTLYGARIAGSHRTIYPLGVFHDSKHTMSINARLIKEGVFAFREFNYYITTDGTHDLSIRAPTFRPNGHCVMAQKDCNLTTTEKEFVNAEQDAILNQRGIWKQIPINQHHNLKHTSKKRQVVLDIYSLLVGGMKIAGRRGLFLKQVFDQSYFEMDESWGLDLQVLYKLLQITKSDPPPIIIGEQYIPIDRSQKNPAHVFLKGQLSAEEFDYTGTLITDTLDSLASDSNPSETEIVLVTGNADCAKTISRVINLGFNVNVAGWNTLVSHDMKKLPGVIFFAMESCFEQLSCKNQCAPQKKNNHVIKAINLEYVPSIVQSTPSIIQHDPSIVQRDLSIVQRDPSTNQHTPSIVQHSPSANPYASFTNVKSIIANPQTQIINKEPLIINEQTLITQKTQPIGFGKEQAPDLIYNKSHCSDYDEMDQNDHQIVPKEMTQEKGKEQIIKSIRSAKIEEIIKSTVEYATQSAQTIKNISREEYGNQTLLHNTGSKNEALNYPSNSLSNLVPVSIYLNEKPKTEMQHANHTVKQLLEDLHSKYPEKIKGKVLFLRGGDCVLGDNITVQQIAQCGLFKSNRIELDLKNPTEGW